MRPACIFCLKKKSENGPMLQGSYFLVFSKLGMKQKWIFKKFWNYVTHLRSWIMLESVGLFKHWTGQISPTFVDGHGFGDCVIPQALLNYVAVFCSAKCNYKWK